MIKAGTLKARQFLPPTSHSHPHPFRVHLPPEFSQGIVPSSPVISDRNVTTAKILFASEKLPLQGSSEQVW
jgi:hypothetical protein